MNRRDFFLLFLALLCSWLHHSPRRRAALPERAEALLESPRAQREAGITCPYKRAKEALRSRGCQGVGRGLWPLGCVWQH